MVSQGDCENKWLCCYCPYRTETLGKPMEIEQKCISLFGDEARAWSTPLSSLYWRG